MSDDASGVRLWGWNDPEYRKWYLVTGIPLIVVGFALGSKTGALVAVLANVAFWAVLDWS